MAPTIIIALAADQVSKLMAAAFLKGSEQHSFLGGFFTLEYAENNGAFLSLGVNLPPALRFWLLTVGTGALTLGLIVFLLKTKDVTRPVLFGLSCTFAGGVGNWLDRVLRDGYVRDFMIVGVEPVRSGIFNVADLLIPVGPLLLLMHWAHAREGDVM
jgi:signal peptidase II